MTQRVRSIINQIVKAMVSASDTSEIQRRLSDRFYQKGYDHSEIHEAFNVIFNMLGMKEGLKDKNYRPVRLFSDLECLKMTCEARTYLLKLYQSSAIDFFELEEVLNYVGSHKLVFGESEIRMVMNGLFGGKTEYSMNPLPVH